MIRNRTKIVRSIDYDFDKQNNFGDDLLVVRAKHYDEWTQAFLNTNPQTIVLNLGCGLDARITRVDPSPEVSWFDVDYPEVIRLRENFYSERAGYRMIASSLADPAWLSGIPKERPAMIVADGVLEYLTAEQVGALLNRLTDHFPHGEIAFDVMTPFAVRSAASTLHDEAGPLHKWAVGRLTEIDALDSHMERRAELPLFASPYMRRLPWRSRSFYSAMCLIPLFKNMLRLVQYQF